MRTDSDSERTQSKQVTDEGVGEGTSISRRGFALATGVLVTPALTGTAVGADGGGRSVEFEATVPYLRSVRDSARAFERSDADTDVRVRAAERETLDRVRDGGVDVHVSGRPPESAEPRRDGEELVGARLVDSRSVLEHPSGTWRECLRGRELRERWTSDEPVETWVEADGRGTPTVDGPETSSTVEDVSGAGGSIDVGDDGDRTTLIRGTRPYQYASGYGGVGYYEVERDAVGPERSGRGAGTAVPVVRLGYLHGTREAVERDGVRAFLRFHERRSATGSGGESALARAAGVGGDGPPLN